jgi:ankyrin repeat protein
LIDHGSNLNVTAKFGLSAMMLAVIAGHKEIAQALARAGADLTLRGTGAPGFAGKTAADLATARDWNDLAIELAPDKQRIK